MTAVALMPERGPAARRPGDVPRSCTWLMVAYAASLAVQFETPLGIRLALSDAFLLAYFVIRGARLRRVPEAWSGWHYAFLAVVWGALLVAMVRVGEVSSRAVVAKAVGLLVLLGAVVALVDVAESWARLRTVLTGFVVGAVASATAGLVAFGLARETGVQLPLLNAGYESGRVSALLIDPNAFGGLLATALLLHACTSVHGRPLLGGAPGRLADVVLPVALVATFSRSAWIGALAGLAAVTALSAGAATRVVRRIGPVVLAAVLLGLWRVPEIGSLAARPEQVGDRFRIAGAAAEEVLRTPLLGTGLDVFAQQHGVVVHNTLLNVVTEMGLLGLLVFVGLLAWHAGTGRRALVLAPRGESGVVLGLVAGLAVGLGLSVGIEASYQRYWWLALGGIGVAGALVARADRVGATSDLPAPPGPRAPAASCRHRTVRRSEAVATLPAPVGARQPDTDPDVVVDMPQRVGSHLGQAPWGLFDQTVSAATNVGLSIAVARTVSPDAFGAFALVYLLYMLALGLQRTSGGAVLSMTYAASPSAELRRAEAQVTGYALRLGVLVAVTAVAAALLLGGQLRAPLLALACGLPLLLLQDAWRSVFICRGELRAALVNDVVWAGALCIFVGAVLVTVDHPPVWLFVAAWAGGSAVAALSGRWQAEVVPDLRLGGQWMSVHRVVARPLLAGEVLTQVPPHLTYVLMPLVSDLSQLGVLRATYLFFGPLGIVYHSLADLALPHAVRMADPQQVRRLATGLSAVMAAVAVAWGACVVLLPDHVGQLVIGEAWVASDTTRLLLAVSLVAEGVLVGPRAALSAWRQVSRLLVVRVIAAPLVLAGGLWLASRWGAAGAAGGFALGYWVAAVAAWWFALRGAREAMTHVSSEERQAPEGVDR